MTSYNFRKRTNPVSYSDEAASQLKLTDLAKVVRLPTGTTSVCFSAESVLAAKEILDDFSSSPEKVIFLPRVQYPRRPMMTQCMHALNVTSSLAWLGFACDERVH